MHPGGSLVVGAIAGALFVWGGSLVVGAVAGALFVWLFTLTQSKLKVDDVLGVWPLHGVCGAWGGIAAGIFGLESMGGMGGVSLVSQLIGTLAGVYGLIKATVGIRLTKEEEYRGADLSIHKVSASASSEI